MMHQTFTYSALVENGRRAATALFNCIPHEDVQELCVKITEPQFKAATVIADFWDTQISLLTPKVTK